MTHPITPPPELVQQWIDDLYNEPGQFVSSDDKALASRAAQWGADQELEACCEWLLSNGEPQILQINRVKDLRATRRPKPPSLKEQALALINHDPANQPFLSDKGIDIIRRALEALPE
jgi:hypothetical protein